MADQITLSPSRVNRWVRCKKTYYWRYHQKLVRLYKNTPFSLGSIVSEALAGYYRHPTDVRSSEVLRRSLEAAIKKETPRPIGSSEVGKKALDDWAKAVKIATRVLEPYHEWASPKDDFEVIHVEKTQEVQLSPSVSFLAIPDAVVVVNPETPMILEHKVRNKYRVGDFGIDYQSVGSCLVSGAIGTMYNVLEYRKLKNHRDIIIRSEAELNYFTDMFIRIGEDILSTPPDQMYPTPMKRCSCDYWELCNGEMQGLDLDDIISELYQRTTRKSRKEIDTEEEGGD